MLISSKLFRIQRNILSGPSVLVYLYICIFLVNFEDINIDLNTVWTVKYDSKTLRVDADSFFIYGEKKSPFSKIPWYV